MLPAPPLAPHIPSAEPGRAIPEATPTPRCHHGRCCPAMDGVVARADPGEAAAGGPAECRDLGTVPIESCRRVPRKRYFPRGSTVTVAFDAWGRTDAERIRSRRRHGVVVPAGRLAAAAVTRAVERGAIRQYATGGLVSEAVPAVSTHRPRTAGTDLGGTDSAGAAERMTQPPPRAGGGCHA